MGLYDARPCPCGSGLLSTWEYDTNGIPLCRTCSRCHDEKMGRYQAGLERLSKQIDEFSTLVNEGNVVSDVLQSIHDNEGWESVERIFWAFQFGYLWGVHADHGPNSAPDVDENRGYQ